MVNDPIDVELFKPESCGDEYHYCARDQEFGKPGQFMNLSVSK